NYYNIVNYYKPILENKLKIILFNKNKIYLRNSSKSDNILKKNFGSNLNFDEFKRVFFGKKIFSYSDQKEKSKIIEILNQNHADSVLNYINIANQVVAKEFVIFEKKHTFKNEIDWHYSFFDDFRWNLNKSEKMNIRPRDKSDFIDVKYVWELNRHQFLPYLGFAYFMTKDEKYELEFRSIILDWIEKNPPLYGINWYSGLEISIRLISWIFSLYFFRDSKVINDKLFFSRVFKALFQHAYYLKYFYTRRSFNHTVGDLFGVYFFSKIFDEFKLLKKWEKFFYRKLKKQIILQLRPDGVNIEQSVNYHKFVLEFFSLFIFLNRELISQSEGDLVKKMFHYLTHIIKPNSQFPMIGDNDDGKVLLLTNFNGQSYIHLLNIGCMLFEKEELKFITKQISPISILLFGEKGTKTFNTLRLIEPEKNFEYFERTGYIVIRNNWAEKASYLFVDFGRLGPTDAPHSHSDITNLIFSYKGKDIFIDAGSYSYNRSWKERNLFRSSKSHNILSIDGKNQAQVKGWFGWEKKPKIRRKVNFNESIIELRCEHNGYPGFLVKRKILTNKKIEELTIKDKVIPIGNIRENVPQDIDLYFHFDKNVNLKAENNSVLINSELLLTVSSNKHFMMEIHKSFYSPAYGQKFENKVLVINIKHTFKESDDIEIITKINPIKSKETTNV
ncbi:MAG: alginate lyase family protein, partial [Candidatus Hermodarchaeota archaeon]